MRAVLIFSGYNNRGIVAFCRFCRKNKIAFFIVASSHDDLILLTDYRSNVIGMRNSVKLQVDDLLEYKEKIIINTDIDRLLILPSTEYLNRFLLTHKRGLEAEGYIIPLCPMKLYELLSDKYSFGELCKQHNIPVPREYENIESAKIPFVAKPKSYFLNTNVVNEKPVIVTNEAEYRKLKPLNTNDFFYQEFVDGNSYYLLYYFSKDRTYSVFSQENLIQQHNGLSIIAAQSAEIHNMNVSSEYGSLLLSLGFTGLIMIEVRFFKDEFYMIEANPRLWGPSQLILDAGMDLFERFAFDNGLINELEAPPYQIGEKYFWQGGIIEDQKKKYATAFHNYSKGSFFDEYASWCRANIYMRSDTESIFFKELAE